MQGMLDECLVLSAIDMIGKRLTDHRLPFSLTLLGLSLGHRASFG